MTEEEAKARLRLIEIEEQLGGNRVPGTGLASGTLETGKALTGKALTFSPTNAALGAAGVPNAPMDESAAKVARKLPRGIGAGFSFLEKSGVTPKTAMSMIGDYLLGRGAGAGIEKAGNAIGSLPVRKINRELKRVGATPVDPQVIKKALSKEDVFEALRGELGKKTAQRQALVKEIADTGVTGTMDAALAKSRGFMDDIAKNGSQLEMNYLPKFKEMVEGEAKLGNTAGIERILRTKTAVGKTVPKGAFGQTAVSQLEDDFAKTMAQGLKEESEAIASRAIPDGGKKLALVNDEIRTYLASLPQAERAAIVESGKLPLTQIDALLLGIDPSTYLAKNLGRLAGTVGAATQTGRALRLGGKAMPYALPSVNAWDLMSQE